jgi:hypothetical protein
MTFIATVGQDGQTVLPRQDGKAKLPYKEQGQQHTLPPRKERQPKTP